MITRPFAKNTGAPIVGTTQIGNIAIANGAINTNEAHWYNGPDEEPGYIICGEHPVQDIQFWRSVEKSDSSFIDLTNRSFNLSFTGITETREWLLSHGYFYTPYTIQDGLVLLLTVQSGTANIALNPSFVKTTMDYTASVDSSVSSVTFTPTAEIAGSTIKINDVSVISGQQSTAFPLNNATNNFNIVVTANGVATTYTVVISKTISLLLTSASIAYIGRNLNGSVNVPMNPNNLIYTTNVPSGANSITVTPYAASGSVVVKVNENIVASGSPFGPIKPLSSSNVVSITVSTPDNTQTRSYTITVMK